MTTVKISSGGFIFESNVNNYLRQHPNPMHYISEILFNKDAFTMFHNIF